MVDHGDHCKNVLFLSQMGVCGGCYRQDLTRIKRITMDPGSGGSKQGGHLDYYGNLIKDDGVSDQGNKRE